MAGKTDMKSNFFFQKVQEKIKHILETEPEIRSSDRLLLLRFWEKEGFRLTEKGRKKWLGLTHFETIRRARQKVQADNPHLRDDGVDQRGHQSEYVQDQLYGNKWETG